MACLNGTNGVLEIGYITQSQSNELVKVLTGFMALQSNKIGLSKDGK